jgi:glutathione S-transferase
MSAAYVSLKQARDLPGLRLSVIRGVPSPWTQAAKGIFHVKGLQPVLAHRTADDPPGILEEWTGQSSFPTAVYEDEAPRSGWVEIWMLAERLAPAPSLLPRNPAERALAFGLSHEIAGEMGLGWCRRLVAIENGRAANPDNPLSKYLGDKYGYSAGAGAAAQQRVIDVLTLLRDRLASQRKAGRRYLIGDALSAVDVYWATFCNLLSPLPPEQCPIPDAMRPIFTATEPAVIALLEEGLLAHRDFLYAEHLPLPVEL